jgi:hypothetical protein
MGFLNKLIPTKGSVLREERESIDRMLRNEEKRGDADRELGKGYLVYLNNDKVRYTNRQGVTKEISLDEMAMIYVEVAGGISNISQVGFTPEDFKNVLIEKREALKK